MDGDTIFLLDGEDDLREVVQTPYDTEALLQRLIQKHPELLAGRQLDADDPPRWLLVTREMGVPDAEDASDRWAIDHLFLDQYGTPTLIEVKRATDTRIRREVVGQMLDYAANAQKYWPVDRLRRLAEDRAGGAGPLAVAIAGLLELTPGADLDGEVERFWATVEENTRTGKLRLVFVADRIPSELRRIIEFLNDKMPDIHVVGLELVQYQRGDLRVLVPRVVGQTEAARGAKAQAAGPRRRTSREAFLDTCSSAIQRFFVAFLDGAEQRQLRITWGEKGFSVGTSAETHRTRTSFAYGFPPGANEYADARFEVYLDRNGFSDDERRAIAQRLKAVAPFRSGGQFTLRLALNEDAIVAAGLAALDVLWQVEAELRKPAGEAEPMAVQ